MFLYLRWRNHHADRVTVLVEKVKKQGMGVEWVKSPETGANLYF